MRVRMVSKLDGVTAALQKAALAGLLVELRPTPA
jgi:hypothetical protein